MIVYPLVRKLDDFLGLMLRPSMGGPENILSQRIPGRYQRRSDIVAGADQTLPVPDDSIGIGLSVGHFARR